MPRDHRFTGIDVGSAYIRVIVASWNTEMDRLVVLGIGEVPSEGVQKGIITDVEEATKALGQALDRAERVSGMPVERAYVSINGSHISSQNSRGVIAVSRADGEITAEDVSRVINAAQAISLPNNREILHVLPQDFVVDGQEHIHDPVGMTGVRLEVDAHLIEGSAPFIKNLTKIVNQAGVNVEDFVFAPLAAATAILDKRQRELGVVVMEMGAGTTGLVVYEENVLLHTAVLPLGASHITNDIAIGLRTSITAAEEIKRQYGTSLPQTVKKNEMVTIENYAIPGETETVSRLEVANIINARLDEIFTLADRELNVISRSGLLPAGVVMTGGGASLPGVLETAKKKLRLPARIGKSDALEGITQDTADPRYAVALGLIFWAQNQESRSPRRVSLTLPDISNSVSKVKGWLRTLLP